MSISVSEQSVTSLHQDFIGWDSFPQSFLTVVIPIDKTNQSMLSVASITVVAKWFGRLLAIAAVLLAIFSSTSIKADDGQWISLFDGKTLQGWRKVGEDQSVWEVKDGAIVSSGTTSMLVTTTVPYKNFRYRADLKINDGGNSGMYFRTPAKPGFSDGYEAQIDSTHTDPIRTGSLYGFCHVYKQLVKPDTWFNYELEVRDDEWNGRKLTRIKLFINGDELYEYLDFERTFKEGHFAFQQRDSGSKVSIRKIEVMRLP